jgi:predicted phosphodiesterase
MLFGDPHGDFRFTLRVVRQHRPEAIVLLGDIQPPRPLQIELASILDLTEVWFIHGNHDTDSEADHDHLFGSELSHRNLHGRVFEIAGLRVAGLGGVFRAAIWSPPQPPVHASPAAFLKHVRPRDRWRNGLPLRQRSTIFPDDYERLALQRADVLVTHEAPGGHPYGWPVLDDLALALGVQVLAHGHLHRQIDYAAEGRLPKGSPYQAHGVAKDCFLTWPQTVRHFEPGKP